MTAREATSCECCPSRKANLLLTFYIISTKLDAEKRLALQEEKQALEAKLLEVYVLFSSTV